MKWLSFPLFFPFDIFANPFRLFGILETRDAEKGGRYNYIVNMKRFVSALTEGVLQMTMGEFCVCAVSVPRFRCCSNCFHAAFEVPYS